MSNFDKNKVKKFFKIRFEESLKTPFHEEQLYYFYAINELGFTDILAENTELVLCSKNQVLISYYLSIHLFSEQDINVLKNNTDEAYWFQNYHLILFTPNLLTDLENSVLTYLIPEKCRPSLNEKSSAVKRRTTYMEFYKENLSNAKALIQNINNIELAIHEYLDLRFEEEENLFIQ